MKKIKTLKNKLWSLTSEYVRRKDADSNGYVACYTCGKVKHWKSIDAGHAIGGRGNAVLFDLEIIKPQCKQCNGPPGMGSYYEFGTKLNQENGPGWYEQKKLNSKKPVKLSRGWYETTIDEMKAKLDKLNN